MNTDTTTKSNDRKIKLQATKREYKAVFDNYCLPEDDIEAECSDGLWVRKLWKNGNRFGWTRWEYRG